MKLSRRIDIVLLLLTALLSIRRIACGEPKLMISPQHAMQYFEVNKPSALMCAGRADDDAGGVAFTEMRWLNPQGDIIPEGNPGVKQMGPNTLKLTFEHPSARDTGFYNCTAVYRNTQNLEASTFITFYEGINWEDCEVEQSLIRDREGRISCKPTGNPKPNINWEKAGQSITTSERISITAEGIIISSVREEDKGIYQVEAFVAETGSNERRDIRVSVFTPPRIIKLDEEFRATEGEQYIIPCEAGGFPKPKYYWYDPKMRDLSQEDGFLVDEEFGSLTITNVKEEYRGNYTCEARNSAGTDTQYMTLVVLVKPVINQFENVTVKEGDDATLVCETRGEPKPIVTIRKDNILTPFGENEDSRVSLQTAMVNDAKFLSLNLKQVRRSDGGLYYCSAKNDAGRADKAGHLEVLFAPNMSLTPSTTVKTWASNPINLTCIAEANPNATIIWVFKNERILDNNPLYQIYGTASYSNLLVKIGENPNEHDVFGLYKCEATNPIGKDSVDIRLELATTPDMLSQVVFEEVKPTSITFKLLGPSDTGGLPLIGYVVRYWNDSITKEAPLTYEWPKSPSYVLTNMKPRTKYIFMFAAKNAVGVGPEKRAEYTMPTEQYPDPPSFRMKDESVSDFPDRFELKWNIPNDNGAAIKYFTIRYFKVERTITGWKDISHAASEVQIDYEASKENPTYALMNLSPNSWYKVELRANNRLGNSFPGYLVFRTRTSHVNDEHTSMKEESPLTLPVIIAIVVVAVLIMLILLDITCYLRFHCGLLYLMRYRTCGRSSSAKKVKGVHMEDGRDCVKEVSTADNGKIKSEIKLPSPKAMSPTDKPFNHTEEKPRLDGVYPAYENNVRPADLIIDESFKSKSPSGSKASIGKSSPV